MPTATTEKARALGKTEPRLFTPPLPENLNANGKIRRERTHGYAAIAFAEQCLHMRLFPWQKWVLVHALELVPNPDGPGDVYRFRTIIVMVARQNGKTTIEVILALWHMYALESGTVIGTAQDLDNAARAWKDAVALAESDEELADLIADIYMGHPKVLTLENGSEYRIAAAHRRGARGYPGDLILIDELREQTNWDSWASVTHTMNARPKAQAWAFSNAGDALSVVLRYLRALAHSELGWPDGDDEKDLLTVDGSSATDIFEGMDPEELPEGWDELTTGFFEYSAPPQSKRTDMEALSYANPSLNHTEVTEYCPTTRILLAAMRSDPPLVFDMEVRCLFVPMANGGPFPEGSWLETVDAQAVPAADSKRVVCVEVSSRRNQTYIARAALSPDEKTAVVAMWADRPGTDWVTEFLVDNADKIDAIVVRTESASPANTFVDDWLEHDVLGELLVEWSGADVSTGFGDMFDRLRDKMIRHLPHKPMDMAATSAVPNMQATGGFRADIRNSPTDTAPLYAAVGAVWGLENVPDNVSIYATEGMMVLT
jgi:hypothetical protein